MIADSAKAPAVKPARSGFTTFPSQTGTPASALGGDDLVINAKSAHQAAAWKFISFLTSVQQQVARAIPTGDAPAVSAAFNDQLYAGAPYFKDAAPVFKVVQNRPVSPKYPQVSDDLQTMLSSVLANQCKPELGAAQRRLPGQVTRLRSTPMSEADQQSSPPARAEVAYRGRREISPASRAASARPTAPQGTRAPHRIETAHSGAPVRIRTRRTGRDRARGDHRLPVALQPVELLPQRPAHEPRHPGHPRRPEQLQEALHRPGVPAVPVAHARLHRGLGGARDDRRARAGHRT